MEIDHIDPIVCPICNFTINDYQMDCFTCPCSRVFCPNCKSELPKKLCSDACVC